jgi:hypothetical protein
MTTRRNAIALGLSWLVPSTVGAAGAGGVVTVVSGTVRDPRGTPIRGVTLHVRGARLSDVLTDAKGWFRLAVVGIAGEIPLRFSLAGYEDMVVTVRPSEAEVELDVVMKTRGGLGLEMTGFERGRRIQGTVFGLAPGRHQDFKVLVYVLTDKWYIHPEAVATAGLGFAAIDPDGRWEIGSVWRGYQATQLALLVVSKDTWTPPTVEPGDARPEDALRSRLKPLALSVLAAPVGI